MNIFLFLRLPADRSERPVSHQLPVLVSHRPAAQPVSSEWHWCNAQHGQPCGGFCTKRLHEGPHHCRRCGVDWGGQ